ncbi:3-keto-5-aminohexanoate cleavage protein [Deinococcus radiodurans]|nr:3-keto-5-aminohexanoate cleavage protein [Deinococcus radiodurans]
MAPEAVADTLHAIRAVCPDAELAISTAEGIAATPAERARLVAGWTAWPDTLCVNLSETGIDDVLALAEARGVALEAGLWTPADVQKFRTLQHLSWRRVLLEPLSGDPDTAHAELTILLGALNDFRPDLPRLAHGIDDATWPLLRRAAALGFESRIGFEDVLTLPDQSTPAGNLDLYQAGRRLMRAGEAEASRLAHHRT